jgi:hypothetical protein
MVVKPPPTTTIQGRAGGCERMVHGQVDSALQPQFIVPQSAEFQRSWRNGEECKDEIETVAPQHRLT